MKKIDSTSWDTYLIVQTLPMSDIAFLNFNWSLRLGRTSFKYSRKSIKRLIDSTSSSFSEIAKITVTKFVGTKYFNYTLIVETNNFRRNRSVSLVSSPNNRL